ncbi:MAG: heme exporter protein CcmB [Alphaproteobacteria bacterium]|nr:heme exporter protein CcmB [Alphaproteobacteria bacterium]
MTPSRYFIFCLRLLLRQRREVALPLFFFLIVLSLFPMVFPAKDLPSLAPAVLWITALLSILLSLNNLFREDVEDGFLTQLLLSPAPLSSLIAMKLLAHWIAYVLPLFIALPLFGLWYRVPTENLLVLASSLALGTPSLLILGAIAAALSAGLKQGGILLMLITLPLATPILLFSLTITDMAANGLSYTAPAYFLLAMAIVSASLGPLVISASLRISIS